MYFDVMPKGDLSCDCYFKPWCIYSCQHGSVVSAHKGEDFIRMLHTEIAR